MRIEEGPLLERPCPHCGGVERRAFGEVESERGELASYAIGWTSDHEDRVGHMTIGIGAGNPEGGSFHARVEPAGDHTGLQLVEEPFADVPQGGPHLTREQALAHVDIRFVWAVADQVMAHDPRAWWMEHWLLGTRAFGTPPVTQGTEPVRHVVRDDDGDWQLLCGTTRAEDGVQLFHLYHALDHDPSLLDVLDLEPGRRADRKAPGKRWKRGRV